MFRACSSFMRGAAGALLLLTLFYVAILAGTFMRHPEISKTRSYAVFSTIQQVRPASVAYNCTVRVGWCEGSHLNSGNPDEQLTTALAEATFPDCTVDMVKLNLHGLWVDPAADPDTPPVFRPDVDLLLCLGWFYDAHILDTRVDAYTDVQEGLRPAGIVDEDWGAGLFWPEGADLVPHRRGRPFIVAFNFEPDMSRQESCHNGRAGRFTDPPRTMEERKRMLYDVLVDCKRSEAREHCTTTPSIYWPVSSISMYNSYARKQWYDETLRPSDLVLPYAHPAAATERTLAEEGVPVVEETLKTEFCAFLVRKCDHEMYHGDAAVRTALFDVLADTYKSCTPLGLCRKTPKAADSTGLYLGRYGTYGSTISLIKPYKFVLAFENMWTPGYFSERVVQALRSDTIPIYVGDSAENLGTHVNLDRVVVCPGFTRERIKAFRQKHPEFNKTNPEQRIDAAKVEFRAELQACADIVREIDSNRDKYLKLLSAPRLPNNSVEGTAFDIGLIAKQLRNVLRVYDSYLVEGEDH